MGKTRGELSGRHKSWKHPHGRGEDSVILLYFLLTSIFTLISRLPQAARCTPVHRPAQSPSSIFRLHCRPSFPAPTAPMLPLSVGLLLPPPEAVPLSPLALTQRWRGREGDPVRPEGGRSAAAGADIARPERPGRFAPTPQATRGGRGTVQLKRRLPRSRRRGSTGVQGGNPSHPMPRAGQATCRPCRTAAARRGKKTEKRQLQKTACRTLSFPQPVTTAPDKTPHERGEDMTCQIMRFYGIETPPRAWGRHIKRRRLRPRRRNTPTGVGKTGK